MIEIPEAAALARQAAGLLPGRTVSAAEAAQSPHHFTWYTGDPAAYRELLTGRTFVGARAWGGHVELVLDDDLLLVLSEGAVARLLPPGAPVPAKHQLCLALDDGAHLVVTVAMYGGIQAFRDGEADNEYYLTARERPSPLTDAFDAAELFAAEGADRLSTKALLATEQRVPGLGNGVLQDICWRARVHPRVRVGDLPDDRRAALVTAVPTVLRAMADAGGRDTERDLLGAEGGYRTVLSRRTLELPCPRCGGRVVKEQFLGGAVYACLTCQPR